METPIVSFSVLTTKEEYCWYKLDCARISTQKRDRITLLLIGVALILGGAVGAMLFSATVINYIAWGICIVTGIGTISYFSLLEPLLITARAQREFRAVQDKLSAQMVELCPTGIHLKNERGEGFYPYEILYRCIRTEHFFIFFFGVGDSVTLALRAASPAELCTAEELLKENLGERYTDRSA